MSDRLIWIAAVLNRLADAVAGVLLAPLEYLPGWLSITIVAFVTGVLLLLAFKYTSNQKAIQRVRDHIKANLLAIRLFKDSPAVAVVAQGRILLAAAKLLMLSLVPMAIMCLPVCLILAQLAQWYQYRPLHAGEETVVTLYLDPGKPIPKVEIEPTRAVEVELGPVRVQSRKFVCWNVKALQAGYQQLVFRVGGNLQTKQFAIGDDIMRVSARRPAWRLMDVLFNPVEQPFAAASEIQSIEVAYPERNSWTCGTHSWVVYWFAVSMVAGFSLKRVFKVKM